MFGLSDRETAIGQKSSALRVVLPGKGKIIISAFSALPAVDQIYEIVKRKFTAERAGVAEIIIKIRIICFYLCDLRGLRGEKLRAKTTMKLKSIICATLICMLAYSLAFAADPKP